MPALIDLRRRIKSVKNTQQITQAMKTVSTAKFKKAQNKVLNGRPLWHYFPELAIDIASRLDRSSHPLLEARREKKIHLLVITSDKGLCGAYNQNLLEETRDFLVDKSADREVTLLLAGKKAVAFFLNLPYPVEWSSNKDLDEFEARDYSALARRLINHYALYRTDAIYVAYNEFKSILAPRVTITKLLPLDEITSLGKEKDKEAGVESDQAGVNGIPRISNELEVDHEQGPESLLETLLPRFVEDQICHYFSESFAAEHAARMMAMDNATKNAGELIDSLTLVLNKIRQSMITNELLEIITAVEALSKK